MPAESLSTRALAAQTLHRVLHEGAYSNVLVAKAKVTAKVDHGLYQRLVYEALRQLGAIDEAIAMATPRKLERIQPEVLSVLRIGTAELRHLRRAPHSAVSYAVDAAREMGRHKAAGFVNGVLRSVAASVDDPVPADGYLGYPEWLYRRLEEVFGDEARSFMEASNQAAETGIRSRDGLERGRDSGIPGARYVAHDDTIAALARDGSIDVIDPASVAVANSLGVEPGDIVADLAAAPGGKTRVIADATGPGGLVVGCDTHLRRLTSAKKRSADFPQIEWVLADARRPPFRARAFDKVLLDAPCTGLGTLRRRPEIRHRLQPDTPHEYGALQRTLLVRALELVRDGGRLVYSVCTVFPEETRDVVAGLGGRAPHATSGAVMGDGALLAPHVTGTDGMFIAVFDR
ncbi:MAG: transcription antitermination factor NusB [Actinomycetota bacterium]